MSKTKVLFVCLGNICRSPAAEAVFDKIVKNNNAQDLFEIDSAGTSAHHAGQKADPRMIDEGAKRAIELTSISRKLIRADIEYFDHIIVMDNQNYKNTLKLTSCDDEINKVLKMTDFISEPRFSSFKEVPDPYFGELDGFSLVFDLLENSCNELFKKLVK